MALKDIVVRQARATGKDYTLPDFDGLSLAVSAKGNRSWHFRYYWAAKQQRMSFGTYPEVSLLEARAAGERHQSQDRSQAEVPSCVPGCGKQLRIGVSAVAWPPRTGAQGGAAEYAFADSAHLRQGGAPHPGLGIHLQRPSSRLAGCVGSDRAAQGIIAGAFEQRSLSTRIAMEVPRAELAIAIESWWSGHLGYAPTHDLAALPTPLFSGV
ncbi:Prophage CP4-57 integrase [Pseudomonas citronellolis]|nr:Prophage CP4-57 integrase [Pseudomonas citronellolis]